jgi:hypothetical protein
MLRFWWGGKACREIRADINSHPLSSIELKSVGRLCHSASKKGEHSQLDRCDPCRFVFAVLESIMIGKNKGECAFVKLYDMQAWRVA